MTSRERVQRTLDFRRPDRVARDLWATPIAEIQHGTAAVADFRRRWPIDMTHARDAGRDAARARLWRGDPHVVGEHRDEWGCVFNNVQAGVMGEVKHPLIDDWSKLSDLRPPVEMLQVNVDAINRFCASTDLYTFGGFCPRPFERLQFIRGTENVYMDLAEESSELLELIRIIHDYYLRELQLWLPTNIDAVFMMDDWGSQRSLLISPAQWRRIFKPLYADYCRLARAAGKKVFMHSDGCIFDIYEDLIEVGVSAVNSQLFCMDIEEIGRRFKGRITFWGEIDRQHIIPYGTPDEARAAVKRVVDSLWSRDGGVIAQFELTGGARMENAEAIYKAWDELTR